MPHIPPDPGDLACRRSISPSTFSLITEHWRPKIVAELNGQVVRLVKVQGEFVWHQHAGEDELFYVMRGELRIELRDGPVTLGPGGGAGGTRRVEHRPVAEEECGMLLSSPPRCATPAMWSIHAHRAARRAGLERSAVYGTFVLGYLAVLGGGAVRRIYAVVRRIPRGRVATYGQVTIAGLSGHARQWGCPARPLGGRDGALASGGQRGRLLRSPDRARRGPGAAPPARAGGRAVRCAGRGVADPVPLAPIVTPTFPHRVLSDVALVVPNVTKDLPADPLHHALDIPP